MIENIISLPLLGLIHLEEDEWQIEGYEYNLSYRVKAYQFENLPIDIDVHFKTVNEHNVKQVSFALEDFKALINLGLVGIMEDFKNKGEAEYYITEWRDDIFVQIFSDEEFVEFMSSTDSSLNVDDRLLSKLRIVRFGVYAESDTDFVTLDYAFGYKQEEGFRDDMLVVKFNQNLKIVDINTEG